MIWILAIILLFVGIAVGYTLGIDEGMNRAFIALTGKTRKKYYENKNETVEKES